MRNFHNRKEYPISGLEVDCTSKFGRRYCAYIRNNNTIIRHVKRKMNKRFRKRLRIYCKDMFNMIRFKAL